MMPQNLYSRNGVNTPSLIDPARSYRPVEHRRRGHASLVATCPESTLTVTYGQQTEWLEGKALIATAPWLRRDGSHGAALNFGIVLGKGVGQALQPRFDVSRLFSARCGDGRGRKAFQ